MLVLDPRAPETAEALPAVVRVGDYPALAQLAWQRSDDAILTPREALDLYERNWRHLDLDSMEPAEQVFLRRLVDQIGGGRPLVRT